MAESSVTGLTKRRLVLHFGLKNTILACDKASGLKTSENVRFLPSSYNLRLRKLFAKQRGAGFAQSEPTPTKVSMNGC